MTQLPTRDATRRTVLFVFRTAPHGSIRGLEGLEAVLMAGAFEQPSSVVFLGDGVFQIIAGQDTESIGFKNFAKGFRILEQLDIDKVWIDHRSLAARGLGPDDLLIEAALVDRERIAELFVEHDVILNF
jgi:tRNA 2-thiouridine synthesizing protein C